MLDMKGLRCVTYLDFGTSESVDDMLFRTPYMRLEWKPDIDFLDNNAARMLFPPVGKADVVGPVFDALDRLTAYIVVEQSQVWQGMPPDPRSDTLRYFLRWLEQCYALAQRGSLRFGDEALSKSSKERVTTITEILEQLHSIPEARLIGQNYNSLTDILEEKISGLEVALENDTLKELYADGIGISYAYPQLKNAVDLIAHKNPRARILEIGAGTGGATKRIMEVLGMDGGFQCFSEYTFTDVTPSFLAVANTKLAAINNMTFATLDIERSPADQGIGSGYDLIIASQVLHATASPSRAVRNARSLLKPGGKMILVELTHSHIATSLVLGMLPGFWNSVQEGRIESPLASKEQWHDILSQNGFSGIDIVLDDHPSGYETASVIVTTAVEQITVCKPKNPPTVIIMASEELSGIQEAVRTKYEQRNIPCHTQNLDFSAVPHGTHVVCLADGYCLLDVFQKEEVFAAFQSFIRHAASLLLVSTGDLITAQTPLNSMMTGLLRTINTENPLLKAVQLELGTNFDQMHPRLASIIVLLHLGQCTGTTSNPEGILTFHQNCLYISRVVPDRRLNDFFQVGASPRRAFQTRTLQDLEPVKATFEHPGALNSLYFERDADLAEDLKHDWVEIKTVAIGLNVKVSLPMLLNINQVGLKICFRMSP